MEAGGVSPHRAQTLLLSQGPPRALQTTTSKPCPVEPRPWEGGKPWGSPPGSGPSAAAAERGRGRSPPFLSRPLGRGREQGAGPWADKRRKAFFFRPGIAPSRRSPGGPRGWGAPGRAGVQRTPPPRMEARNEILFAAGSEVEKRGVWRCPGAVKLHPYVHRERSSQLLRTTFPFIVKIKKKKNLGKKKKKKEKLLETSQVRFPVRWLSSGKRRGDKPRRPDPSHRSPSFLLQPGGHGRCGARSPLSPGGKAVSGPGNGRGVRALCSPSEAQRSAGVCGGRTGRAPCPRESIHLTKQ